MQVIKLLLLGSIVMRCDVRILLSVVVMVKFRLPSHT